MPGSGYRGGSQVMSHWCIGRSVAFASIVVAFVASGPTPSAPADEPAIETIATPIPAAGDETDSPWGVFGPAEIQSRAAAASEHGNLLDAERGSVRGPRHAIHVRAAKIAHVRRIVLGIAAEEARNRDAGLALDAYWSLAEAEHGITLVDSAIQMAEAAIADRRALVARGLDVPIDETSLQMRRLSLDDARSAATAGYDTLSASLARLAALPPGPVHTIHPATTRAALDEPPDVEAAVAEGRAQRAELRVLRAMLAHLDEDTVEVARGLLAMASPALATTDDAGCGLFRAHALHHRRAHERAVVARQLQRLLHDRETAVETEIRQAVRLSVAAAERVAVADRQLAAAEAAAAEKRGTLAVGGADAFAIHAADLEVAAARRSVLERLAAWLRARARVMQATGSLAPLTGCRDR